MDWSRVCAALVPEATDRVTAPLLAELSGRWLAYRGATRAVIVMAVVCVATLTGSHGTMHVAVLVLGAIAALALLRWSWLGVPALVIGSAFVGHYLGNRVPITMIAIVGLSSLWVLERTLGGERRLAPSLAKMPWIAFMVTAALSILAGDALWNPWVTVDNDYVIVQFAQLTIFGMAAAAYFLGGNQVRSRGELKTTVLLVLIVAVAFTGGLIVLGLTRSNALMPGIGPVFRLCSVSLAGGLAFFLPGLHPLKRAGMFAGALTLILAARWAEPSWQAGWLPAAVSLASIGLVRVARGFNKSTVMLGIPIAIGAALLAIPRLAVLEFWSFDTRVIAWRGMLDLLEGRWLFGLGLSSYWHYWRGVFGHMAYLDPTGYLHFTYDPQVNMHNNYLDLLGQVGLVGMTTFVWLIAALAHSIWRTYNVEEPGFGQAYAAACGGILAGMLFAAVIADWILPFVYNIGLRGFQDAYIGWLLLGGLPLLDRTRGAMGGAAGGRTALSASMPKGQPQVHRSA